MLGYGQSSSGDALVGTGTSTSYPESSGSSLSNLNYPFTVTFWMKLNAFTTPNNPIFCSSVISGGYSGIRIAYNSNNEITVSTGNNNGFTSFGRRTLFASAPGAIGKWVHVAVNMTGPTTGAIYMNGRSLSITTGGTGNTNFHRPATGSVGVGVNINQQGTHYLNGQLDEMSVWSRTLTIAEIRQLMCQKLHGNEVGLEAYWRMDGTSTTIPDLSSNNNDLTYTAGSGFSTGLSAAPVGDTSVFLYSLGTATMTSPSGVALTVSNNTGAPDGVHAYFVNSHPDQDQGIGSLCDTIGHFGRFIATNPAQPNISGQVYVNPPMSSIYSRAPANTGTWSTTTVTQTLYFSDIYREFLFDPGQFADLELGPYPACDSTMITAPPVVGGSYTWSNGQTTRRIQNPGPGTHWLTLTTNCKTVTDTFEVFRDTVLDANALPDSAFMCGNSGSIAVYPYANRPPIDTVYWTDGVSGITRSVSSPGWYYAYTGISNSCWYYDSIYVASAQGQNFSLGNDTTVCVGDAITLSLPNTAQNIIWSTGSSANTITVSQAATYWVTFEWNSCSMADSLTLTTTTISASVVDTSTFCTGGSVVLSVSAAGMDSAYWSTGQSGTTITVSSGGTYWVQAFNGGCFDYDTAYVFELTGLSNAPDVTVNLCRNETVDLTVRGVVDDIYINNISWSTGEVGETINVSNPGIYTATGTTPCGPYYIDFFVEEVICEPIVYFPTAFTPNGDGLNDVFEFKFEGVEEFRLIIVDRWGNVVFETTTNGDYWNAGDSPLGTYSYILTGKSYIGETFNRSGYVNVLR